MIHTFPAQFYCQKCKRYVHWWDVRSQFFQRKETGEHEYINYHVNHIATRATGHLYVCEPVKHIPTHRAVFVTLN